jgi:hypothetical protein
MSPKHTWEQEAACNTCGATGLYIGFAERDGAAVVCRRCKGTGKITLRVEWEEFTGRKDTHDVSRVFQTNPGVGIGTGTNEDGDSFDLKDFGGISYDEWREGALFPSGTEMRRVTCPAWWYQCADYNKKPEWRECLTAGSFSWCQHFNDKEACWRRLDKENADES